MEKNHELFTAGQFAKLHNINKRTLHYYNDIGLFSPAYKGENGYGYYTYLQSTTLEMLLTLRELNMSIKEIDNYMKNRSAESFRKIIEDKTSEINENIKRLKDIRKLLANKESQLAYCEKVDINSIEVVECPEEYLLLSKSITGAYDDRDFAVLIEHTQDLRGGRLFNKCYGSMICADKIKEKNFTDYDCFFTKVEKSNIKTDIFIKPSGKYIRAFCKGSWEKIPNTYHLITAFAAEKGLTFKGYAYEEGINEMTISNMNEYLTMINIWCE